MRRGLRDPDEGHVKTLYENAVRIARSRDAPDVALSDFEQTALDFEGLVDLDEVETTIERLRQDPTVARGEKTRQRWIRHEDSARQRLVTQMRKMEAAVDDAGRRAGDLRDLRRDLERHVRDTESEDKHRADAAGRLVAFVTTVGFERGIVAGQNGDYERAALFYEIALQAAPESRGLRVLLAGMYARMERFDRTLETLSEAIALGFADANRLRVDEDFEALRDDPRFAELLARLESR